MFRNYIKIARRNLWKNRFYTSLNVFGLSIGIACLVMLFQFISYHLSFDTYHKKSAHIYRIVTDLHLPDGSIEYDQGAPLALAESLKMGLPQIKNQAVLLKKRSFTVSIPQRDGSENKLFSEKENVAFTNHQWFELFDYTWIAGNPGTSLEAPFSAVITKAYAEKYFGQHEPIGKVIKLNNKHTVKITGIVDNYPANTDIKTDIFLSLSSFENVYPDIAPDMQHTWDWVSSKTSLFVLLADNTSAHKINKLISGVTKTHMGEAAKAYQFHLQPLEDVHFNSRYGGVIKKSLLTTLAVIGVLLIIIASVNFINLATAQSAKRAREVGVRKVLGSTSAGIFWQYMTETAIIIVFAVILAIFWIRLFLPVLNNWIEVELVLNIFKDFRLFISLIILFIILVFTAGFYPAVIVSRFKPINALKGILGKAQHTSLTRKLLVIGQNTVAQILIICTLVIAMQVKFLKTADLGFNEDAIIMIPVPAKDKSKMTYLRNQLMANPDIKNASFCFRPPTSDWGSGGSVRYNKGDWEKFPVRSRLADTSYLKTFGLQLIAGRNVYDRDTINEFLVNERLVEKLGIHDPQKVLGSSLVAGEFSERPGTIVGVVKNFHSNSLYSPLEPAIITTKRDAYDYLAVKMNGINGGSAVIKDIRSKWESVYPDNVFEYNFLDDQLAKAYQNEDILSNLIKSSAVIAIALSCLGLLGLISLMTVQRTKEIGIRKVLGASVSTIVILLFKDFIKLVIIAILIAFPIAYYAMNVYLQDFAYRIDIEWWIFALSGILSIIIVLLTISFRAIKAAKVNPVKSLKME